MGERVAVVGAGYAGMAAAVTLAERGVPVTVFESAPVPGGRARRVLSHGDELDNGQHILVGAYGELFRLMRKVGVPREALLRLPLEIRYVDRFRFRSLSPGGLFGLAFGLLLASRIPFTERVGAVRFMARLRRAGFRLARDRTVRELLAAHRQDGKIGHYLWRPMCIAALNTPIEQASANVFLAALRDTLAGERAASDLLLPRVDLSRLFPEPAAQFVERHGGNIKLRSPVSDLKRLQSEFASVIVAVGPHQLRSLLPDYRDPYTYQPIYTCYLQYPQNVKLEFPMLGLAGGLVQWVFDRGALTGERGRLACVISAQGDHQQMPLEELCELCHRELAAALPGLPAPRWSRAIAEKRATISCIPNLKRPAAEYDGVYLAGDYTDPEYPPTLEAAVRSGVRAALKVAQ
jgi:hydroxysqualene dehydroxylase